MSYLNRDQIETLRDLERTCGKPLLEDLVRIFTESSLKKLQLIRQGIERRDLNSVKEAAHALKSSAGNIGAQRMFELCAKMENAARNSLDFDYENTVAELNQQFEGAKVELYEELDSGH